MCLFLSSIIVFWNFYLSYMTLGVLWQRRVEKGRKIDMRKILQWGREAELFEPSFTLCILVLPLSLFLSRLSRSRFSLQHFFFIFTTLFSPVCFPRFYNYCCGAFPLSNSSLQSVTASRLVKTAYSSKFFRSNHIRALCFINFYKLYYYY